MPLKNRVYVCPECNHIEDRDLNASKNLERWFDGIHIPKCSDVVSQ
nr:transposase [Calothrix parietina]